MDPRVAADPEVRELIARTPHTSCPDWCELPEHADAHIGTWHEGAITRVRVSAEECTIYCDVSEGADWAGNAWDLRISISGEAGKLSAGEARAFANGILRAADLYDRLTADAA
jgi:hypothetical protein